MNGQRARQRHRETAGARRRDHRRQRLGLLAALAVVVAVGIGGLAVSVAGRSGPAAPGTGALPGLQTGPAPWNADTADAEAIIVFTQTV